MPVILIIVWLPWIGGAAYLQVRLIRRFSQYLQWKAKKGMEEGRGWQITCVNYLVPFASNFCPFLGFCYGTLWFFFNLSYFLAPLKCHLPPADLPLSWNICSTFSALNTRLGALKCYYDQKYEFVALSIFQKYKYILLTVQSFKSKFVREVRLF